MNTRRKPKSREERLNAPRMAIDENLNVSAPTNMRGLK